MNGIINNFVTVLNSAGKAFCDFSITMLIQSSVLIVLLFIIDFLIRRRVRATFRYWIWMLVFIKLVLPPALSLPTGIGNWFGEYFVVNSTDFDTHANERAKDNAPPAEPIESVLPVGNQFSPQQVQQILNNQKTGTPVVTLAPQTPSLPQTVASAETSVKTEHVIPASDYLAWQGAIFLIWLVGVLILSVLLIQRIFFVRTLIAQSESAKNRLLDVLQETLKQLGIRQNLRMKLSYNASSPAVCGLFKPVILIPANLLSKISHDKLKAILIHELSHIKRADLWVNCVQTILQIIYFYNPLVWFANSIVRRIREQAVDEMVLVALGAEAKSYSNTLIDVAEMAFSRPALSLRLVGVVESKKALSERIKHILSRPIPKSARLGIFGLLVIIITAAVLLPMAKKAKINHYIDGVEGYIRCSVTHSESSRAILNMSQVYNFKHERSRSSGDDESPIQYSADNYIIPDNKKLTFETVAEKGQQLRIDISVEPGAIYTTEEITIELARQLGILPKTAKQLIKKEISSELPTDTADPFTATLPSGMTVELVGICQEPFKGAKWWKPDGSGMNEPSFEASTRTPPMGAIPARYTFLAKANGAESISMKAKIYEGNGFLSKVAQDGTALCFVKHPDEAKPNHADAFEKGSIEIGIAQGQWIKGRGEGDALHIPTSYLIGSSDEIVIQPPRADSAEPDMVTSIWASTTSHDYEFKLICKLKDGSTRESEKAAFQSTDTIETGGVRNSAINTFQFVFDKLTFDQIVDYELYYRKFEFVRFNNVAFKPGIKTDVQIENLNNSATEDSEDSEKNKNVNVKNKDEKNNLNKPFSVVLPSGLTVELLGICDIPSEGKQWWAADGNVLENVFWDGTSHKQDGTIKARQIVFRIDSNESNPDIKPSVGFYPERKQTSKRPFWTGWFVVTKNSQTFENLRGLSFSLDNDQNSIDIAATVGYGNWQTQASKKTSETAILDATRTKIGELIFNDISEKNGKTSISATLLNQVETWRIIAIDKHGTIHAASEMSSGGNKIDNNNQYQVFKAEFLLPLSDIEIFHFQTRDVEKFTFKNVSLEPGIKTDVQIEKEIAAATESIREKEPENLQQAMDMAVPLYGIFSSVYSALNKENNPQKALGIFESAQPQMEIFVSKLKGTSLEVPFIMVFQQVQMIVSALKNNDVEKAKGLMEAINTSGPGLGEMLENAAKKESAKEGTKPTEKNQANKTKVENPVEKGNNLQSQKILSDADKQNLFGMFLVIGTNCESIVSELEKGNVESAKKLCETVEDVVPKMQALAKSTQFEIIVTAGAKQFDMMYKALKEGDIEKTKTYLNTIMQMGNNSSQMFQQLMSSTSNSKPSNNKAVVPSGMVGTWFFDNPGGDDEQMAIFSDGKVVVLYSNGHKDQSHYENGEIELAEYGNKKYKLSLQGNETLIEYIDSQESGLAKIWRRIDAQPRTELIKSLTGKDNSKISNNNQNAKYKQEWGEMQNGLKCGLIQPAFKWNLETPLYLALILSNEGQKQFHFTTSSEINCEVEVDGKWYGWAESLPEQFEKFPFDDKGSIEINLSDAWALPKDSKKLQYRPGDTEFWGDRLKIESGKHIFRVKFRPLEWLEGYKNGEDDLFVISNPIEIEYLHKSKNTDEKVSQQIKEETNKQNKEQIILQADVVTVKQPLSVINDFLAKEIKSGNPKQTEYSEAQIQEFKEWAASLNGTYMAASPKSITYDGQSTKMSLTTSTEYKSQVKDINFPDANRPENVLIKTGFELELVPNLGKEKNIIFLNIKIQNSEPAERKGESVSQNQFPSIIRRETETRITMYVGQYYLFIISGTMWQGTLISPQSPPDFPHALPSKYDDEQTILIIKAEVLESTNTKQGILEFRIAPDSVESSRNPSPLSPEQEMKYKEDLRQNGPEAGKKRNDEYIWVPVRQGFDVGFLISQDYQGMKYLLVCNRNPFILLPDPNWCIEKVSAISDNSGRPAISVVLNDKGGELFYKLTSGNLRRSLAMIVNNKVVSVPAVMAPLQNSLMIVGNFSKEEVQQMINLLQNGH